MSVRGSDNFGRCYCIINPPQHKFASFFRQPDFLEGGRERKGNSDVSSKFPRRCMSIVLKKRKESKKGKGEPEKKELQVSLACPSASSASLGPRAARERSERVM